MTFLEAVPKNFIYTAIENNYTTLTINSNCYVFENRQVPTSCGIRHLSQHERYPNLKTFLAIQSVYS